MFTHHRVMCAAEYRITSANAGPYCLKLTKLWSDEDKSSSAVDNESFRLSSQPLQPDPPLGGGYSRLGDDQHRW